MLSGKAKFARELDWIALSGTIGSRNLQTTGEHAMPVTPNIVRSPLIV
jgi:hypothetical protein